MNNTTLRAFIKSLSYKQKILILLIGFLAVAFSALAVVIYNNSVRSSPIYLFLLLAGIGMMLSFGMSRGGLLALLVVSVWITAKRLTGVWTNDRLLPSLLEIALTGATFFAAGVFHSRLMIMVDGFSANDLRLKQLDLEDRAVGLIKPAIGLLRLTEEVERSMRYRRPLSVILIQIQPALNVDWMPREGTEIVRAIGANIKDTTRDVDIPFLAAHYKVALILPETDVNGANRVISNISKRMTAVQYITNEGKGVPIQDRAQIRFGMAIYLGGRRARIELMEAAERSLQKSIEMYTGDVFQNLFIEQELVGEQSIETTPETEKATP